MAIDTLAKRHSALTAALGLGWPGMGCPPPDGSMASDDRQALLGRYGGIAASVPVLVPVVAIYLGPQPR